MMRKTRRNAYLLYALIALGLVVFVCLIIATYSHPRSQPMMATLSPTLQVMLDAGHGGLDGGAVSPEGVEEAAINLAIAQKSRDLLCFLGIDVVMTRDGAEGLDFDEHASIRDNKNADLRARRDLAQQYPGATFLSIHLNSFSQSQYWGAQVFYSPNHDSSRQLATALQDSMRTLLAPDNDRKAKMASSDVWLMQQIDTTAVTIECGFLSNTSDVALLTQDSYQTQVALAIVDGYLRYVEGA